MTAPRNIIWIASFPKSGNTWVRAFLGNYFKPTGKTLSINELSSITTSDIRNDWFDLAAGKPFVAHSMGEWAQMRTKVQRLIAQSSPGHRFVKTHSRIDRVENIDLISPDVTAAAICVIRNPFDIAVSFARHSSISIDISIDRIASVDNITAAGNGILEVLGRWDYHIKSWLKAPGLPHHVMRYEDMIANPKQAFTGLLNFLQVPIQQKTLHEALKNSSFETLKKQEKHSGFKEKPPGMDSFFTSGKSGAWVDKLSIEQVERIYTDFRPTIEEYFPEVAKQAAERIAEKDRSS